MFALQFAFWEKEPLNIVVKKYASTILKWFRKLRAGLGNFSFGFDLFDILVWLIKNGY